MESSLQISAKELANYTVHALDGELGHVSDLLVDDMQWRVRYVVADTGKWLPGRKVPIAPESLSAPDPQQRIVPVNLASEQVRNSPTVDMEKPVSRQTESELAKYFGWTGWWGPPPLIPIGPNGIPAPPLPEIAETRTPVETAGPHLRSVDHMIGYTAEARDGEVGRIDDFIVDAGAWAIVALIVETGHFWSGRKIPVDIDKLRFVSWQEKRFLLDVNHWAVHR